MELTPEERQRIYLEEKARFEIRQQLEAGSPALRPVVIQSPPSNGVATLPSSRFRMTLERVLFGLSLVALIVLVNLALQNSSPPPSSANHATSAEPRSTPPASPSHAHIGETVTVRHSNGFWPCSPTTEAFDEIIKWVVRGDKDEIWRSMRATGSIAVDGGMSVKILDIGIGKRRIRVLTNDAGEAYLKDEQGSFPADLRIGRECWVVSEALSR